MSDLIYRADCNCNKPSMPPPPPPYWGMPDYPPPPPPFYPCPPPPVCPKKEEENVKSTSIEGRICKLSKNASVITAMIEALETKKKDAIVKVGDLTYNFGKQLPLHAVMYVGIH